MAVVRWNPWQEIDTLHRQFDRLFSDTLAPTIGNDWKTFGRMPAAELSETEDAVQLKLEVPGVDARDLDVQVTEDMVSIKGERKSETRSEDKGMSRSEFYYGSFQRVIPLPARIQNTQVQAEYKNGILHLTMPKTQDERNKVVKVELN